MCEACKHTRQKEIEEDRKRQREGGKEEKEEKEEKKEEKKKKKGKTRTVQTSLHEIKVGVNRTK